MDRVPSNRVRRSVIAGSWYPGSAAALKATVDRFLQAVEKVELQGEPLGLIAPHAGYMYSGQVAAYAYKQVEGLDIQRVVVVSPMHRMYAGRFAVTDKLFYETPLGLVEVDADLVEGLQRQVDLTFVGQDNEHSLEIQLPFLQRLFPKAKLLPVMMGVQDLAACQTLGRAIAEVVGTDHIEIGSRTLLVASTDLSHFHPQRSAKELDQVFVSDVEAYDVEGLAHHLAIGKTEACGGGPVMAVMLAARRLGADRAVILKYATSGDVSGDYSSVVGYAAGVLYASEGR